MSNLFTIGYEIKKFCLHFLRPIFLQFFRALTNFVVMFFPLSKFCLHFKCLICLQLVATLKSFVYIFRSYDRIMTEDKMMTNKDGGNDSDDFM